MRVYLFAKVKEDQPSAEVTLCEGLVELDTLLSIFESLLKLLELMISRSTVGIEDVIGRSQEDSFGVEGESLVILAGSKGLVTSMLFQVRLDLSLILLLLSKS